MDLESPVAVRPESTVFGLRSVAVASLGLAVIVSLGALLSATGVAQRLMVSSDSGAAFWVTAIFNFAFGVAPALLWLWILMCLWMRSRDTAGSSIMLAALLVWIGQQVLGNVWPALQPGTATTVLTWLGTAFAIAWPLLLGFGLIRSAFLSPLVARLALAWGIAYAVLAVARTVVQAVDGSIPTLTLTTASSALSVAAFIPTVMLIVFLIALGTSVLAPRRFESISARLTTA